MEDFQNIIVFRDDGDDDDTQEKPFNVAKASSGLSIYYLNFFSDTKLIKDKSFIKRLTRILRQQKTCIILHFNEKFELLSRI